MTTTALGSAARVLAMRTDNIGDVVMLGPALRAVRTALSDAHITLLASPAGAVVAPMLPWVDDVIVERVVWQDASGSIPQDPERELALVRRLAARRFDAALIFTSFSQTPWAAAYACHLAGIPVRAGESKEFGGGLLTNRAPTLSDDVHQVDRNLDLVQAVGIPPAGRDLELHVRPAARRAADGLLSSVGVEPAAPFVCLAPGASCAARRYDVDRYADVAPDLAARSGLPVVIVGGGARDEQLADVILRRSGDRSLGGHIASLVGRTSIEELAAVIARCAVLVANDSGPMHLGDAFRRPMVVLYSGTELESQWEPRFSPARLLRRPTACAPCHRFDCPYDMACLDIPPDEVVDEALRLLDTEAPPGGLATHSEEPACVPYAS